MNLADLDDAALAAHLAAEAGRLLIDVREGAGLAGKALGVAATSDSVRQVAPESSEAEMRTLG